MSDDPLAWVRAEMDAAEAVALAAQAETGPRWRSYYKQVLAPDSKYGEDPADANTAEAATHIARRNPAAVLRRITADRKQLELHPRHGIDPECARCVTWDEDDEGDLMATPERYPCATVRLVAESWGWMAPV